MKKIIILSWLFFVPYVYADDLGVLDQMLDAEIENLIKQRDEKYAALKECEKTTEGFKIAGITTLAATGVGVYGNIKLYQKNHGNTFNGGAGNVPPAPTSQQNLADLCVEFPDEC